MACWLFKTEAGAWSWDKQKAKGGAGEPWTGVRNYQARNMMRRMRRGDLGFFYHSGEEKRILGVVEVIAESHPDPTDASGTWDCVDVMAVADLATPVTLAAVRGEPRLQGMALLRNSRLSVQPVSEEEWRVVCEMGGLALPSP